MDTLSPVQRSAQMAKVRSKSTKPELVVRKLIFGMGFRYRLHRRDLPGSPDLVFPSRRKVVFVHGCFWHRHQGCKLTRFPKSREEFWKKKFSDNVARDFKNRLELEALGWSALIVWECELRDLAALAKRLYGFLSQPQVG